MIWQLAHIFFHPDFCITAVTVGFGITPNQLARADYTAGEEFHLALKQISIY